MTAFSDMLAADVNSVFLNPAENGEMITYYPADGSEPRPIVATVDRTALQHQQGAHHLSKEWTVNLFVKNSATLGIDQPKLGDSIGLSEDGQAAAWDFDRELHADSVARTLKFTKTKIIHSGQLRPDQL